MMFGAIFGVLVIAIGMPCIMVAIYYWSKQ
jgi:hypothetical protein